jgi:hypothetical protein
VKCTTEDVEATDVHKTKKKKKKKKSRRTIDREAATTSVWISGLALN